MDLQGQSLEENPQQISLNQRLTLQERQIEDLNTRLSTVQDLLGQQMQRSSELNSTLEALNATMQNLALKPTATQPAIQREAEPSKPNSGLEAPL